MFGAEWLRSLGMVPNEYLYYFYFASETVARARGARRVARTCSSSRRASTPPTGDTPEQALAALARGQGRARPHVHGRGARRARGPSHAEDEPGGYEAEALAVVEAITADAGAVRILNVANRSALPFLDERAVVEVPCVVSAAGVRPLAVGPVPDHARALVETVKAVERTTIDAALTGSHVAGRQGARPASARSVGDGCTRDLRRIP